MTFSLIPTRNGFLSMPKVNGPALPNSDAMTDARMNAAEFVNENEGVLAAYRAHKTDSTSRPVKGTPSSGEKHGPRAKLSPGQRADGPISPNYDDYSITSQAGFASFKEPLKHNPATSIDESGELQRMQSSHLERKRREKSPELKFQTFQKSANFDTFRPLPRPYFSSDAKSVWPLRSIEESRLLQHFVENLASWVRFVIGAYAWFRHANTAPSLMLAIARDISPKLHPSWPPRAPCS